MGNTIGARQEKPVVLGGTPYEGQGFYKATFEEADDHTKVKLAPSEQPDAYFLPWRNDDFTEGVIDLTNAGIVNFFTAPLSGCSLWIKSVKAQVTIRHEARTDQNSQAKHQRDGFELMFDSCRGEVDFKEENMLRTAVHYEVYGVLDKDDKLVEFRIQEIRTQRKIDDNQAPTRYKLVQLTRKNFHWT